MRRLLFSSFFPFVLLSAQAAAATGADSTLATHDPAALNSMLVIGDVGTRGRLPVHTDAVEAQLVAGTWSPPADDAQVALPDGVKRTWQRVTADQEGWIRSDALRGGYAYAEFESARVRIMLLEASGHSLVYVNGVPRVGDPYATGFVRVPVRLKAGDNNLLFLCGRGRVRARLIEPAAPVLIDPADVTVPDVLEGHRVDAWGSVVVINARSEWLTAGRLKATFVGVGNVAPLAPIPPLGIKKVTFRMTGTAPVGQEQTPLELVLQQGSRARTELARAVVQLAVKDPRDVRKRTYVSPVDDSAQYFAVQPARPRDGVAEPGALFLSLHGASVEAIKQARAYAPKDWGTVVAPTNRRPFGFDWEDWGRIDALDVLDVALSVFDVDPRRVYLTGHSMGGHGVWHVGATYPDRFAAIGPSAGWVSFWSYAGARPIDKTTPIGEIMARATNGSNTLALSQNLNAFGVYILHGAEDDNVPVREARSMRAHLGEFHTDFSYYEHPGAGHWWGNRCVDWPPMFSFFRHHERPQLEDVAHVRFSTANPAVSAACTWATIEAQHESLALSHVDLRLHSQKRTITGTTQNVARLQIALRAAPDAPRRYELLSPDEPVSVELDGTPFINVAWPDAGYLRFEHDGTAWRQIAPIPYVSPHAREAGPLWSKGPHRAGPFKEAFRNHVTLVYGTAGTPAETAWALTKAQLDSETFWYRGNGSLDIVPDTAFDPTTARRNNVVLYGNADTNAAWASLFADSPVQVRRGTVTVGERSLENSDLAVLAVYPRPETTDALVAVVSGSGLPGMRLTDRLPYFVSGVAYPDWVVIGTDVLVRDGVAGIRGAGFYGNDWQLDPEQSALTGE